jgi:hypothetical protein
MATPLNIQVTLVPPIGAVLGETAAGEFFYTGTKTPVPIYSDSACTQVVDQPFLIASTGEISYWVADNSFLYDLTVAGGNLVRTETIVNVANLPGSIWNLAESLWQYPDLWNVTNPALVSTKTAQNIGQMYTANDIIRAAMRLIQVSAVDTDLTANELNDGLESLNRMLDSWSADELTLYEVIREQFPLVSGQNPYTIGYGGNFNTSRPMKIVDAYLILNNGSIPVSYPMQVLGYDDYNSIRLKTLSTNFPNYMYYQPSFPLAEIFIYPVFAPNDPSTQGPAYINITSWKPFDIILDPTAYMSFPPGYQEAITFNLAIRLAMEYQFDLRQDLIQLATNSLKRIKRLNQRTVTLSTDVALMNTSQLRFNIYSDGFGR